MAVRSGLLIEERAALGERAGLQPHGLTRGGLDHGVPARPDFEDGKFALDEAVREQAKRPVDPGEAGRSCQVGGTVATAARLGGKCASGRNR